LSALRGKGSEIHHFAGCGAQTAAMATDTQTLSLVQFVGALASLDAEGLERVGARLDADHLCDEVDWWRATIAIDKVVRHARKGRQAARAAADAASAVQDAAVRAGIGLPDDRITRVARAAADVARGLAAGPPAEPVTRILLEVWEPVRAGV
jgi:hypothetical protein